MEKTIKIKGISVDLTLNHNDGKQKASVTVSIQDGYSIEPLQFVPGLGEWEDYEAQIMFGLEEWVIETKSKSVAGKVAKITEKAIAHNLSQSKTKIDVQHYGSFNEVEVRVWGNFKSTMDRVGELLHTFSCPIAGNNEYDCNDEDDTYDLDNVWQEVEKVI